MESGSTVVLTFISNNIIICANCGDSRAILIVENGNKVIPLSRDHKPDLPEEKKRIKGRDLGILGKKLTLFCDRCQEYIKKRKEKKRKIIFFYCHFLLYIFFFFCFFFF